MSIFSPNFSPNPARLAALAAEIERTDPKWRCGFPVYDQSGDVQCLRERESRNTKVNSIRQYIARQGDRDIATSEIVELVGGETAQAGGYLNLLKRRGVIEHVGHGRWRRRRFQ